MITTQVRLAQIEDGVHWRGAIFGINRRPLLIRSYDLVNGLLV